MDWTVFFAGLAVLTGVLWVRRRLALPSGRPERIAAASFPFVLLLLLARTFVAEPFRVASSSMEPGLGKGDIVLASKISYGIRIPLSGERLLWSGPERGDTVVFLNPQNTARTYVKRVAGIPGDVVEYSGDSVKVNGVPVPLPDGSLGEAGSSGTLTRVTILSGRYFMLGDNRANSVDSRSWGLVPKELVIGKVVWP